VLQILIDLPASFRAPLGLQVDVDIAIEEDASQGGKDTLRGGAGNDILSGSSGNYSLTGGTGKDLLVGGASLDTLKGAAGEDLLIAESTTARRRTDPSPHAFRDAARDSSRKPVGLCRLRLSPRAGSCCPTC